MHLVSLEAHVLRAQVLLTAALAAAAVAATGCAEEEGFPVERRTTLAQLPEVGAEVTIEQGSEGMKLEVIVRYAGRAHSPDRALGSKASPYCPVLGEGFAFHLGDAGIGVTSSGELEVNGLDEHFVCHHPSVTMIVPPFLQRADTQLILRDSSKTITIELGDRLVARAVTLVDRPSGELLRDEPFSVRFSPDGALAAQGNAVLEAYAAAVPPAAPVRQYRGASRSLAGDVASFVYPGTAAAMQGFLRFPIELPLQRCGAECRISARYQIDHPVTVR